MKQGLIITGAVVVILAIIIGVLIMTNNHSTPPQPAAQPDKLQVIDQKVGTGATVKAGDTVTVSYTGTLADGTVFDSTAKQGGQPATFSLNQVIQGWQEGIPGMKVGGTRKLVIPVSLAYGANPPAGSGIPANATLTFVIDLLAIK